MIRFYYNDAPNPMKIALLLEELGMPYEVLPLDTRKGEQHHAAFRTVNPNGKAPAITDTEAVGGETHVFDSSAILLYLAEKAGRFLGTPEERGQMLSWMFWISSGLGPYSGQAVHFARVAPEPKDYAVNRYMFEAHRHYKVLEDRLAHHGHIATKEYSIVDMSAWGWVSRAAFVLGSDSEVAKYPHVRKWFEGIEQRPAVSRARAIAGRFEFKKEMDEDARRHMFPHLYASAAAG